MGAGLWGGAWPLELACGRGGALRKGQVRGRGPAEGRGFRKGAWPAGGGSGLRTRPGLCGFESRVGPGRIFGAHPAGSPPLGVQPRQARGLLPEERGERAAGQAQEAEAAKRRHLPPGLPGPRRPRPGPRRQGRPAENQRAPAALLAPATGTPIPPGAVIRPGGPRAAPPPAPTPPNSLTRHPQTEQKYFYKQRNFFYVLMDRVRDAGRKGACWGLGGCPGGQGFPPHTPFLSTAFCHGWGYSPLSPLKLSLYGLCNSVHQRPGWGGRFR